MEEIKVNDYVRTKKGEIHKVIAIEFKKDPEDWNYYKYENDMGDFEMFIAKHSTNIIDLIEVGDYVNGYPVTYVCNKEPCPSGKYVDVDCDKPSEESYFFENQIKSVVTHESFNSIKYEVI